MGNWYNLMTFKRGRTKYITNSSNFTVDIQNDLGNGVPFNNPKAIVGSNGFIFNTESKLYNKHRGYLVLRDKRVWSRMNR